MRRLTSHLRLIRPYTLTPTIYMTALREAATAPTAEIDALTERSRATWTSGDFGRIAKGYTRGASEFVTRLCLTRSESVLDVACGTGSVTLPAARLGAAVTAIDLAPNLLAQAQMSAVRERLSVSFDIGNAEQLPYADRSFQTVVSLFGAMFAARPDRAASELIRVTRPGGRIAMANWTPTSFMAEMVAVTSRYAPVASAVPSPLMWGSEEVVRNRLGAGSETLTFTRRCMTFEFPFGPEQVVNEFRLWYGPTLRAFAAIEESKRDALRRDLETLWSENNRATDGTTRVQSEYLEVLAYVH